MNADLRSLAFAPLVFSLALAGCGSGEGGGPSGSPDAGAPPEHAEPPVAGPRTRPTARGT